MQAMHKLPPRPRRGSGPMAKPQPKSQGQDLAPGWGERLREARERLGLSREAAGSAIAKGRGPIEDAEKERRQPSLQRLKSLAAAYRVELDWLLTADPSLAPEPIAIPGVRAPQFEEPDPRYRVLCPECGTPLDPRESTQHLEEEHPTRNVEAALGNAKRDPRPWIAKCNALGAELDGVHAKRARKGLSKTEKRSLDAMYDEIVESLERVVDLGSQRYRFDPAEWPPRK